MISEKAISDYQAEFGRIGLKISEANTFKDWAELYRKLVFWERELDQNRETGMQEVFQIAWNK